MCKRLAIAFYGGGNQATNIHIPDNRISRGIFPAAASGDPWPTSPHDPGNTFTGNIWDDTGKPATTH